MLKNLNIGYLLDFYKNILPEKQAQMLDMYYNEDLSLKEIAEDFNITRQGVRDYIKRGEETLINLEQKLMLVKKIKMIEEDISSIKSFAKEKEVNSEILDELDKLSEKLYL
ncbi:MAG: HTH domain-containing protein [Ruminococcaceae bacterium]|nr:HTH domain-containing protein [Oscillospiraceae bacterium]